MTPSSSIKRLARSLGFDEVGITSVNVLKEGARAIEAWVREGRHGGMKYLEDFRKRHEKFFADFPDAKSVIVLGVNYYTTQIASAASRPRNDGGVRHATTVIASEAKQSALKGKIARYAWGRDYHEVIRKKHEEFIKRLSKIVEQEKGDRLVFQKTEASNLSPFSIIFRAKSCVDIQPLPERFAAAKAGLGFVGKNTVLLSRRFGPWLFLSEVVTNLELEEDIPEKGDCGTCNHCQTACPTGALDKDYTIDARRCIAYLTIEHKGSIPEEIRPHIKDWIFGCDECLTVCPFTSKSKESGWEEFQRESGFGEWLEIEKLFEIKSNSEYERKFRGTAMMRVNRKQMLRNACIVLGNSGDPRAVPMLEKALHDPSPLVRDHAAWGLTQLDKLRILRYSSSP